MKFFQDIPKSIFNFSSYRDFSQRSVSQAMKFLLGLVILITLILAPRRSWEALNWIEIVSNWMQNNLPEISIVNGEATSPVAQPFKATGQDFIFILDTSGSTTELDPQYPTGILVTKKNLIFKEGPFQRREYDLAQFSGITLNKETVAALKRTTNLLVIPIISVGLFLYFFIAKVLQVLSFGPLALLINAVGGIGLSYRALYVIGVYALIPAVLLGTLVDVIGVGLPLFAVLYLSLYLVYLVIGILQSRSPQAPT